MAPAAEDGIAAGKLAKTTTVPGFERRHPVRRLFWRGRPRKTRRDFRKLHHFNALTFGLERPGRSRTINEQPEAVDHR